MNKLTRRIAPLAAIAALALTSACSSATSSTTSSSAANSDSPCVQKATTVVDKARAPLDLTLPEQPLDGSKLAGKNVWLILILTNQWSSAVADGFKKAGEALGEKVTVFDGQGQVNKWNEGIAQAIAQHADAISLLGIDPSLVSQAVKDAQSAGIPVLNAIAGNSDDQVPAGIYDNFSADYRQNGYDIAAWTIADSGCQAHSLYLYGTGVPLWDAQREGGDNAYKELCPDDCTIEDKTVDLANLATEMGRTTQTELTQNPDINYVYPANDSAVTFVEPAVTQVRPSVKIVSRDGISQALAEIRKDGQQKATIATPPEGWIGYTIVDDLGRAILGMDPNGLVVPTRLIDKTNVGSADGDVAPAFADFENAYAKLWGLS
jgi:ABC-type sugar transport system substrate-binding protein